MGSSITQEDYTLAELSFVKIYQKIRKLELEGVAFKHVQDGAGKVLGA